MHNMVRKFILLAGIMILGMTLVACNQLQASEADSNSSKEQNLNNKEQDVANQEQNLTNKEQDIKSTSASEVSDNSHITKEKDRTTKTKGDSMEVSGQKATEEFYYEEITDEVKKRIAGKSYGEKCDVPYEELRYVRVLYWGFDDETHDGELIVNKYIAKDIVEIFEELYEQKYPIERMVLVDEYDADDNVSMAADNTSAFNYRKVDGTDHLSLHSYGLAIDINPRYNPYVRGSGENTVITPENGIKYANRSLDCSYYINAGDICYKTFIDHGFTWGGEWKTQKDYQHFQKVKQ